MAPPTMAMRGWTTCVGMRLWAKFLRNAIPSTTLLSERSPSRRLTCRIAGKIREEKEGKTGEKNKVGGQGHLGAQGR